MKFLRYGKIWKGENHSRHGKSRLDPMQRILPFEDFARRRLRPNRRSSSFFIRRRGTDLHKFQFNHCSPETKYLLSSLLFCYKISFWIFPHAVRLWTRLRTRLWIINERVIRNKLRVNEGSAGEKIFIAHNLS